MPASIVFMGWDWSPKIQFDAVSNSGYQSLSASYSWSHTCTGNNRFLVVDIAILSVPGTTVSGVTYNSVALSFIGAKSTLTGAGRIESWGLIAPSAGSNTIAVSLSASVASAGEAVSHTGVDQTTATEAYTSAQGSNVMGAADATVTLTTLTDFSWIHAACATDDTSVTAGQTLRNNVTGLAGSGINEDFGTAKTPTGNVTMTVTGVGVATTWAIGAFAIRPYIPSSSSNQTVTPGVKTLTTSLFAPTVSAPRLVTPGLKTLSLSLLTPTVLAPRLATPSLKTLSLVTLTPTISVPRLATPGVKTLTTSLFAPVVLSPRLTTLGKLELVVTLHSPTAITPNILTVSAIGLSLTFFSPTIALPVVTTPSRLSLGLSLFPPTVVVPRFVIPSVVGLSLVEFPPTVLTPRTVNPNTVALVSARYVPLVSTPILSVPGLITISLLGFPASVVSPRLVIPNTVSLSAALFVPFAELDWRITPETVSLVVTLFAPSAIYPLPPGSPEEWWNATQWQAIRVFSARLSYKRVWSARIPPIRVVKKDGALQRTCSRPINHPNRVWSYNNMSLAKETLYKYTVEEKTFGADYSEEGALKSGETVVSGTVSISPSTGTPPTAGTVEVITSRFTDSDGKVIMPYKGLKCRLTGGDAATRVVTFLATTSGGDKLAIPGKLVIESPTA